MGPCLVAWLRGATCLGLGLILAGCGDSDDGDDGSAVLLSQCFTGGSEEFELNLPYYDKTITVPMLPDIDYDWATTNAMVSVPAACATAWASKIKKSVVLNDRQGEPGGTYFKISDFDGGFAELAVGLSGDSPCACGLLIETHGTGGPGWTAVQFATIFPAMGFIVILPNSQSMPDDLNLKGRLPMKDISEIDVTNYCGSYSAFQESCSGFQPDDKPFCYSSKPENVVANPDNYRKFVEGIYEIRRRELDYFFSHIDAVLKSPAFNSVYLAGNSEGAMVASRYHNTELDSRLSGRILSAWSCEFNYFLSCEEHASICGDNCNKDVPQLNIIGSKDEYFSKDAGSVASKVAMNETGYGAEPLTGNCRAMYNKQGFTTSTVVVSDDTWHGSNYYDDNTWQKVINDFLAGQAATEWNSLSSCTLTDGVYHCPKDGPTTCKTIDGKYQVNPAATYTVDNKFSCAAQERRMSEIIL